MYNPISDRTIKTWLEKSDEKRKQDYSSKIYLL